MLVIPAVDVLDGRAVRLTQGDYDRVAIDAGDPLALVRRAAGLAPPFVHVVALGAARDGGLPLELARDAVEAAAPVPVQLGGGVRSVDDAKALRAAGVARVLSPSKTSATSSSRSTSRTESCARAAGATPRD